MVIFHEFFPITKSSILDHAESLKKEELSSNFGGGDVSHSLFVAKQNLMKGLTEKVRKIVDGTQEQLMQSRVMEKQLSRVHRMIETVDDINFIIEPGCETYNVDPQRFRVAACESILSMKPKIYRNEEKTFAATPSTPKPEPEPSKPTPKPSSKVEPKNNRKLPIPSKGLTKTVSMPALSSSKKRSDSVTCFAVPKNHSRCSQKLPSPEIQQILKAAKEKRVSNRSEIKIPVVELKFLK